MEQAKLIGSRRGIASFSFGEDSRVAAILASNGNDYASLNAAIGTGNESWVSAEQYASSYLAVKYLHSRIVASGQADGIKHMTTWMKTQFDTNSGASNSGINTYFSTFNIFKNGGGSFSGNADFISEFKGSDGYTFIQNLHNSGEFSNADTGSIRGSDEGGAVPLNSFDVVPDAMGSGFTSNVIFEAIDFNESQPIGTIVGEFNATDPDGDGLIYSLVSGPGDENNSLFSMDANGTLKTAAILDYEAGSNLSIRVQAKDEFNASLEGNFSIVLKDVDEPPVFTSNGKLLREVSATFFATNDTPENGTYVNSGDGNTYKYWEWSQDISNQSGRMKIDINSGVVGERVIVKLGDVTIFDTGVLWATIGDARKYDFDRFVINFLAGSIAEFRFVPLSNGNATSIDIDGADGILGTADDGVIPQDLNYDNKVFSASGGVPSGYLNQLGLTDDGSPSGMNGLRDASWTNLGPIATSMTPSDSTILTLRVESTSLYQMIAIYQNSFPTIQVFENQSMVVDLNATDDEGDPYTFSLVGGADMAFFDINATTGFLSFKTPPDFENNKSADGSHHFEVVVEVSGSDGNSSVLVPVQVLDINESPIDLNVTAPLTIAENQPFGTIVGEFNATDLDANATLTYHLVSGVGDDNNSLFTMDANGTLKTAAVLDYEAGSNLSIRIQVRDQYNATVEDNFTVTLTNLNEPGTGAVSVTGTPLVGQTLTASNTLADPDGLGTITYQWYRDGQPIVLGGTLKDGVGGVDGLDSVWGLTLSADGNHAYVVGGTDNAVSWYERNASTGALTYGGMLKDGVNGVDGLTGPRNVRLSADGSHAYVVGHGPDNAVSWYDRNASTGVLAFGGFLKDGVNGVDGLASAFDVTLSADGLHAYIVGNADWSVSWYERNASTGALSYLGILKDGHNGVDGLAGSRNITLSADGKHIYITAQTDDAVSWYERNATTGALSYLGMLKDGVDGVDGLDWANDVVISSEGNHAYITGTNDQTVGWYERNATTGALSYGGILKDGVGGVDGLAGARQVKLSADGKHLYVTGNVDNALSWYERNASTGALTYGGMVKDWINGVDGLSFAYGVTLSADGRHVYATGKNDKSVSWFTRNPLTGALSYGSASGSNYTLTSGDAGSVITVVASYTDGGTFGHNVSSAGTSLVQSSNSYPTDLNVTAPLIIAENHPVGTIVGEFNATDPDGGAITYHLVSGAGDGNNSLFTLDTNGTLRTATTFDYETNASTYFIRVQAKDEFNATAEGNFTVSLMDVYEPSQANHFVDLNATVNLEMIWVEPGTFTMGSPTSEFGRQNVEIEHNVTLTRGFYLGKYEVTQAQYEGVMTGNTDGLSATPSQFSGNPNRPVENVSWNDVQVFLTRLNHQQADSLIAGWQYVLPTEAQWEYSCRGGTTTTYSWGNEINASHANYDTSAIWGTTDVGQYDPNPWGFYDMHGNVFEPTRDAYGNYQLGAQTDPFNDTGSNVVFRGGSWDNDDTELRSAFRGYDSPSIVIMP